MSGAPELDRAVAQILVAGFPEVAAAWVFGSEARGEARPGSDLDIGVLLRDRHTTILDAHRRLRALAAVLERVVPGRRIDLALLSLRNPVLAFRVLSEGRLVHDAEPDRRIDFESDACVRYWDYKPTWELGRRLTMDGMREWLEARP